MKFPCSQILDHFARQEHNTSQSPFDSQPTPQDQPTSVLNKNTRKSNDSLSNHHFPDEHVGVSSREALPWMCPASHCLSHPRSPRHCKSFSFVASGMLGKDGLQIELDAGRSMANSPGYFRWEYTRYKYIYISIHLYIYMVIPCYSDIW